MHLRLCSALILTMMSGACGGPDEGLGASVDALRDGTEDPGDEGGGGTVGGGSSTPKLPPGCNLQDGPDVFSIAGAINLLPSSPLGFESCPQPLDLIDRDWYEAPPYPNCADHRVRVVRTDANGTPTANGLPSGISCLGFGSAAKAIAGNVDSLGGYAGSPVICELDSSTDSGVPTFVSVSRKSVAGPAIHYRIDDQVVTCHEVGDQGPLPGPEAPGQVGP